MKEIDDKNISDRVNFEELNGILEKVFINNGVKLPFLYSIVDAQGKVIFQCHKDFHQSETTKPNNIYTQKLFPLEDSNQVAYLQVVFPTKQNYILSSLNLLLPSIGLIALVLGVFIVAITIILKQKQLAIPSSKPPSVSFRHHLSSAVPIEFEYPFERFRCHDCHPSG